MTDHTIPRTLAWAWEQQRIWSLTANRLKHRLDRARTTALVLTLAAAVLAVAATQLTGPPPWIGPVLGVMGAIAAGAATALQRRVSTEQIRTWTRARSASEGLKTEIYAYLAGGITYTGGIDRDRVLGDRTRALVSQVGDLHRHTLGITADTKPIPAVGGVEDYFTHRVEDQIHKYYRPKASFYERRVRALRGLATGLGAATVVLSAVAGLSTVVPLPWVSSLGVWTPVATTAAATVAAHIAASRYDHLVIEYLRTAQQLEHLRDAYREASGDPGAFVDACEQVISIENQGWMTRWTTDAPGATQ